jgi:hypothetical protein
VKSKANPLHQKETEWHGPVYVFEAEPLSPDSPEFKRRARRRRPANGQVPAAKKRGKPKK